MRHLVSFLVSGVLLVALPVYASPEQDFKQAGQFFASGDYEESINKYHQAEKQGMRSVELYYNLAGAYYKIGNYQQAEVYFKKVAGNKKMQALATYNLGLVALKQGDNKKAKNYFNKSMEMTDQKKLKQLAAMQLNKMNNLWSVYFNAGLGSDDNVNFTPTGSALNVSDTFYALHGSVDYLFSGSKQNGWLADASFYNVNYSSSKSNASDQVQYGFGIEKTQKINQWNMGYLFHLDQTDLGGFDYQAITKLQVMAGTALSSKESLQLRYRYEDINSENVLYDYLDGWRQKFRVQYKINEPGHRQRYYYELELNSRNDTATASYSPTRHTVRGVYTQILDKQWRISGDLAYRQSSYSDVATWSRDDDRLKAAIYGDYRLDRTTRIRAEWAYTDNDSTQNAYDYTRNVVSVDISKRF